MKSTLQSRLGHHVAHFLTNGHLDPAVYRDTLKSLHTSFVTDAVTRLSPNPLLGAAPPAICTSERSLTRH